MQRIIVSVSILLAASAGCSDAGGGGAGGSGGNALAAQSSYRLACTIDTLTLEIPIEAHFELDRPFGEGAVSALTFSAAVTFGEPAVGLLLAAGISTIDIISMDISAWVTGAIPMNVETALGDAPINDFNLTVDPDDNGVPGPHSLELEAATITMTPEADATAVEFGLRLDQIALVLGDFRVPDDCLNPALVGSSARFLVAPAD